MKLVGCTILLWALLTSAALSQPLFTAVMPSSRAVNDGDWATAFVTVINPSAVDANGCQLVATSSSGNLPRFEWRLLDDGEAYGPANAPFSIGSQSETQLLISASDGSSRYQLGIRAECENGRTSMVYEAVNTFAVSFDNLALDVIPVIATLSNDGVIRFDPQTRRSAFSLAAVVIDGSGHFDLRGNIIGFSGSPSVRTLICETGLEGVCLNPRREELRVFLNQIPRYFSFIVEIEEGYYSPFFPETSRYQIQFQDTINFSSTETSSALSMAPSDTGQISHLLFESRYTIISRRSDDYIGDSIEAGILYFAAGETRDRPASLVGLTDTDELSFRITQSGWLPPFCNELDHPTATCRFAIAGEGNVIDLTTEISEDASINCLLSLSGGMRCRVSPASLASDLSISGSLLPIDSTDFVGVIP